jgi:hypothetical protein
MRCQGKMRPGREQATQVTQRVHRGTQNETLTKE